MKSALSKRVRLREDPRLASPLGLNSRPLSFSVPACGSNSLPSGKAYQLAGEILLDRLFRGIARGQQQAERWLGGSEEIGAQRRGSPFDAGAQHPLARDAPSRARSWNSQGREDCRRSFSSAGGEKVDLVGPGRQGHSQSTGNPLPRCLNCWIFWRPAAGRNARLTAGAKFAEVLVHPEQLALRAAGNGLAEADDQAHCRFFLVGQLRELLLQRFDQLRVVRLRGRCARRLHSSNPPPPAPERGEQPAPAAAIFSWPSGPPRRNRCCNHSTNEVEIKTDARRRPPGSRCG